LTGMAESPSASGKRRQKLVLLLGLYTAILLFIVPRLSLWLDEILGLIGVRYTHLGSLIDYLSNMPGGVPLAYATQWAVVKLLGYSVFSARLTSIICSVLAAVGVFALARRLPVRHPLWAVAVYCLLPLQFRYALEARPYGVALCFSVWATVCFFALLEKVSIPRTLAYGICIVAGLYSQPYTFFVPLAHVIWVALARRTLGWKFTGLIAGTVVLSAAAFLPWYLYARYVWQQTAASYHSHIELKSALMILHELTGAGYIGAFVILSLAIIGIRRGLLKAEQRLFWSLYLLVPVAGAIAGDLFFGYFLAIRQMLFIVAPLALLCVLGVESRPRTGSILSDRFAGIVLIATLIAGDIVFLRRPREDWGAAARFLSAAAERGACLAFVPDDSTLYEFFEPRLAASHCHAGSLPQAHEVDLAINPYDAGEARLAVDRLAAAGFTRTSVSNPRGPQIYVYQRR
jgi:hypothetical protein